MGVPPACVGGWGGFLTVAGTSIVFGRWFVRVWVFARFRRPLGGDSTVFYFLLHVLFLVDVVKLVRDGGTCVMWSTFCMLTP